MQKTIKKYLKALHDRDKETANEIELKLESVGMDIFTIRLLAGSLCGPADDSCSRISVRINVTVSDSDVEEILYTAIGSSNYNWWCEGCNKVVTGKGDASADIGKYLTSGGVLEFAVRKPYEKDSDSKGIKYYDLTKKALTEALRGFLEEDGSVGIVACGRVNTSLITEEEADDILQMALFGYRVY